MQEEKIRMGGFAESVIFDHCWRPCPRDPKTDLKAEKYFCKLGLFVDIVSQSNSETLIFSCNLKAFLASWVVYDVVHPCIIFRSYYCKKTFCTLIYCTCTARILYFMSLLQVHCKILGESFIWAETLQTRLFRVIHSPCNYSYQKKWVALLPWVLSIEVGEGHL